MEEQEYPEENDDYGDAIPEGEIDLPLSLFDPPILAAQSETQNIKLAQVVQARIHQIEKQFGGPLSGPLTTGTFGDVKEIPEEELKRLEEEEEEEEDEDEEENLESYDAPEHCIPIRADVTSYDWKRLFKWNFDVIMMDPPWQLAGAAPTRGVALGYDQLRDDQISSLPVEQLQINGFIFIWVINSKYEWTVHQMRKWGYAVVDSVDWVKRTVNRRLAKGHGFYLQHAKETCLVGVKGEMPPGFAGNVNSDVIWGERRGQSQKPEEIYELVEKLVPSGLYLEIFARKNNLRDYWVSVGMEL